MQLDMSEGTTTVITNMEPKRSKKLSVSSRQLQMMASVLSNLYNDPETAIIREYIANGLDAHTAAGKPDEAVEVFFPTESNPYLTITDHGVGMSEDFIYDTYSEYFESTKRGSDGEIGGFGLGCKSALALASQFTVKSTKDGTTTYAIIAQSETGAPDLDIVYSVDTDEGNGTTVSIPLEPSYTLEKKIRKFLYFLEPSRIKILDGSAEHKYYKNTPDKITTFDTESGDSSVSFVKSSYNNNNEPVTDGIFVVMGGMYYEIPWQNLQENLSEANVSYAEIFPNFLTVMEVPVGSVKLSPNREGVQFSEKTVAFFNGIIEDLYNKMKATIVDSVESATTFEEATKANKDLNNLGIPMVWEGINLSEQTIMVSENYAGTGEMSWSGFMVYSESALSGLGSDGRKPLVFIKNGTLTAVKRVLRTYAKEILDYRAEFVIFPGDETSEVNLKQFDNTSGRYGEWETIKSLPLGDLPGFLAPDSRHVLVDFSDIKDAVTKHRKEQRAKNPRKRRDAPNHLSAVDTSVEGDLTSESFAWEDFADSFEGRNVVIVKNIHECRYLWTHLSTGHFSGQLRQMYPDHILVLDNTSKAFSTMKRVFKEAESVVEFDGEMFLKLTTKHMSKALSPAVLRRWKTRRAMKNRHGHSAFLSFVKNEIDPKSIKDSRLRKLYRDFADHDQSLQDVFAVYRDSFPSAQTEDIAAKVSGTPLEIEESVEVLDEYSVLHHLPGSFTAVDKFLHLLNAEYDFLRKTT